MAHMPGQFKAVTVHINGSERDIPEGTTLEDLVSLLRLQKKTIVVERNRQVADKTAYALTQLKENDQIEIVHFVGGG